MADPRVNQIRIKTGVLKRYVLVVMGHNFCQVVSLILSVVLSFHSLVKEKIAYEKELEREKQRLEKMKEEERDVYETNKQVSGDDDDDGFYLFSNYIFLSLDSKR